MAESNTSRFADLDPEAIFSDLMDRYEGLEKPKTIGILMYENPDLKEELKTLLKSSKELFGHTLVAELRERGLIDGTPSATPAGTAPVSEDDIRKMLAMLVTKYSNASVKPSSIAGIKADNPDYKSVIAAFNDRCRFIFGCTPRDKLIELGVFDRPKNAVIDATEEEVWQAIDAISRLVFELADADKPKTLAELQGMYPELGEYIKAGKKKGLLDKASLQKLGILAPTVALLKRESIRRAPVESLADDYRELGLPLLIAPGSSESGLLPYGVIGLDIDSQTELRECIATAKGEAVNGLSLGDEIAFEFKRLSREWGEPYTALEIKTTPETILRPKSLFDGALESSNSTLSSFVSGEAISVTSTDEFRGAQIRVRYLSTLNRDTLAYAMRQCGAVVEKDIQGSMEWRYRVRSVGLDRSGEPGDDTIASVHMTSLANNVGGVRRDNATAPLPESLDGALRQTYEFLLDYVGTHGCAPTVRAVADAAGCSISTAHQRMGLLESRGFISRDPGKPRAMTVAGLQSKAPRWSGADGESEEASVLHNDMADSLSGRHREAFVFIDEYIAMNGYGPSVREIADSLGVSPSTAHGEISYLCDSGFVRQEAGSARTLSIAPRGGVDEGNSIEVSAEIALEPAEAVQDDAEKEVTENLLHPLESKEVIAQQGDSRTESLSDGQKRYLAAITKLAVEGQTVRAMDIANKLGVSRPAVSKALSSLEDLGLIVRSDEGILLVPVGVDPKDLKPDDEFADAFPHLVGISDAQRKYLATIAALAETGEAFRATDIASKLDVSKPAVSKALAGLEEAGLILRDRRDIRLTPLAVGGERDGDSNAGDECLEVPAADEDDEGESYAVGESITEGSARENAGSAKGWTFSEHQRAMGRRFTVEVPDQWVLTPEDGGRPLARYEHGVKDASEYPQITCNAMVGDLDKEVQEALRTSILPETRIQLLREALYGNDEVNELGRVVDDWVIEGKNCQVQVFEVLKLSTSPEHVPDSYEYHVKPVAYDHEDFLRISDPWNHLEKGQLKELAHTIALTVELDKPVELSRPAEIDHYCDESADADAFCELVGVLSSMLNMSASNRMNADLWREVRRSDNNMGCLLVADTMPRIQTEAYNAGLNDEVAYYGRLVKALEKQRELDVDGFEKMWKLVGEFGDVRVVDHVTVEGNEEIAKAVNSLGIITIPDEYQTLRERWVALDPSMPRSEVREATVQSNDEAACVWEEEETARKLEAEARQKAEEAARKVEAEVRRKVEEAARKAEEEARRRAEGEAKRKAEGEAARLAEIEAKRKAEADLKQKIQDAHNDLMTANNELNRLDDKGKQLEAEIQEHECRISEIREIVLNLKRVGVELDSAKTELDSLGFFAFGKKGELRGKIQQLEQSQKVLSEKLPADVDESIKRLERLRDEAAHALTDVKRKASECQERVDAAASVLGDAECG